MTQRFLIIANPIAGGGRGSQRGKDLQEALQEGGARAELFFTEKAGDAHGRASQVGDEEWDCVISVGGDGTLNEVLNGLPDPSLPLAMLPMGTANVLAVELGLPRETKALAALCLSGQTIEAAIGLVQERRFLLFASCGMDAAMVQRLHETRRGTLGKRGWIRPVWHCIWHWPIQELALTTVEGQIERGLSTILVTRVRNYGGIMTMPGGMDIKDGQLHVLAFRQRSRWQYLRASLRAMLGRLRPGKDCLCLTTQELEISGGPAPYQVDGDLGGLSPLRISLAKEKARIVAPLV